MSTPLKTPVIDRAPKYPGRVVLAPVSGQANTFDMVRADEPTTEGTPLGKALFDQKAYTLTKDVTVYVSPSGDDDTGDGTSAAPYKTIQKAVDSVPFCLGGFHAQIDIEPGTYEERVSVDGFYGGRLTLGVSGRAVTVRGISMWSSGFVRLYISNITATADQTGPLLYMGAGAEAAIMENLVLVGNADTSGINMEQGSSLVTAGTAVTVDSCGLTAVAATTGARIAFNRIAGSGNTAGALRADNGAVISYVVRTLEGETLFTTTGGGKIYGGAQSNPAEY